MQRKRIAGRSVLRKRRKSGDQSGSGDEVERRCRQHGHVHGLADVARCFGTSCVVVQEAAASREIQQDRARKDCQSAPCRGSSEYTSTPSHKFLSSVTLMVPRPASLLPSFGFPCNPLLDPATIPA